MFSIFAKWLGRETPAIAHPDVKATFLLKYGDLLIGTLTVKEEKWRFEYSDEFRKNASLRPLVEFPDINGVYEHDDLWQFFAGRIPSVERDEVVEILEREHIPEDDAVLLLKRFGKKTISSPFLLEYV